MAVYLNASLEKVHEWDRFVDFSVVRDRKPMNSNIHGFLSSCFKFFPVLAYMPIYLDNNTTRVSKIKLILFRTI